MISEPNSTIFDFFSVIPPCAEHITFDHSHPPRKIIPKCPFGIPIMNYPASLDLVLLYYLIRSLEFPRIVRHLPGGGPQIGFLEEDEVDMLGSSE